MVKTNYKKRRMIAALLLAAAVLLTSCSKSDTASTGDKRVELTALDDSFNTAVKDTSGYYEAAKDGNMTLSVDGQTCNIEVKDQKTGSAWYTNPVNRASDTIASGDNADMLNAQVSINYIRIDDGSPVTMNSYTDAIQLSQFDYYQLKNGIGIRYTLGKKVHIDLYPQAISAARFQHYLSKVSGDDKDALASNYQRVSLSTTKDQASRALLLQAYPVLRQHDIYVLGGYSGSMVSGSLLAQEIEAAFKDAGYTTSDLKSDNKENNIKTVVPDDYSVTISVEYTLDNGNLVARIPKNGIVYDSKVLVLTNITVLPYFGAADSSRNGYILVPDGSGALINFNNNKLNVPSYTKDFYNSDNTAPELVLPTQDGKNIYMPVFGIKDGGQSFLGVVEKGDVMASLTADTSKKSNNYNYVYTTYLLKQKHVVANSVLNASGNTVYQDSPISTDIQIRYLFQTGDQANYTGMASSYQNYLLGHKLITAQQNKNNSLPLYLDMVGAITYKTTRFGIPVDASKELTSYKHATDILDAFRQKGINNLLMGYVGWMDNGVSNTINNSVHTIGALGSKSDFNSLTSYLDKNDIAFYPDFSLQYVSKNKWFDGFDINKDSAKDLEKSNALYHSYDMATQEMFKGGFSWIISPAKYNPIADSLIGSLSSYDIHGVNLSTMSMDINSDFAESKIIDRNQAQSIIESVYEKFKSKGFKIAVTGANAYTYKNASLVVNAPLTSGGDYMIDEDVPFYQITLHGVLPYTSEPLNLSDDLTTDFLKTLESGSIPFFRFIYQDNTALMGTSFNLYSVNYKQWFNDAVDMYKQANAALGDCQNSRIVAHSEVSSNVNCTTFANGKSIYVNYNSFPVKVANVTINPKSYQVLMGGQSK